MKRSRTCHCLVELDDTPKRTRSTSNLDSLQRWLVGAREKNQVQKQQQNCENQPSFLENGQKFGLASAVRLLQWSSIPEEGGMAMPSNHPSAQSGTATSPTLDSGGSKARSKSLNEITILGHEQFIARNDDGLGYFVGTEQRLRFSSASSSRDDSPYEGDTGDSSDYFYGVASSDEADDEISLIPIGSGGDTSPRKVAGIIGRYATPSTVDTDSTDHMPDVQSLDIGGETGSNEELVAVSCDGGDPLATTPATTLALSPTSTWVKLGDSEHGTTHGREEDSEKRTSCPRLSEMVSSFQAGATVTSPEREERQQVRATVSPPWPTGSLATFSPLGDAAPSDEAGLVSSAACGMSRLKLADSKPNLSPVVELGLDQIWNSWDAGEVYSDKALERSFYPRAGKA